MAIGTPFLIFMLAMAAVAESVSWDSGSQWDRTHIVGSTLEEDGMLDTPKKCHGSIGECMDEEEEMMMDSEINRRVLWARGQRFISYDALKNDRIPCSRRGHSYYNCRRNIRANPYRRGCSVITRCYRFTK
ncbi:hypothetical protein MRB53_026705 [Persea americana]|uniref:Uncharacterized protein n=1 Tax=Persea americana TaxID=3435 RepID=A0ACC2LIY9_PERAE|nr:hypothetical protein MRB53_026705 [Persea americana]